MNPVTRRRRRHTEGESHERVGIATSGSLKQQKQAPFVRRGDRSERRLRTGRLLLLLGFLCIVSFYYSSTSFHWTHNEKSQVARDIRVHPLEIVYDSEKNEAHQIRGLRYEMSKPAAQGYPIKMSPDPPDDETCEFKRDWQTAMYPACNSVHEIDVMPREDYFVFVNCGGDRCAFKLTSSGGTPLALKIPRYERDFSSSAYYYARLDGMALERLTASPYLVDIYGYCGLSQVLEYGGGGNLHDLIKIARQNGRDDMSPNDKLRIGIQIASAVSDTHSFEEDKIVSLTHNDLCCHQFILVDGVYKLNDFHLGTFVQRNKVTDEVCPDYSSLLKIYGLVHSPEELEGDAVLQEQADDYVAGNVMFYVLTKEWLYQNVGLDEGYKMLAKGIPPPFPRHIANSTDPADQAMVKGISMLWTFDVMKRPKSRVVADFLIQELEKIEGKSYKNEVIRVQEDIAPLPPNHRFTDSDYHANLYRED